MATYQFKGQDIVAPFRITSNEPAFVADTVSLKQRRVTQGSQRWELEFGVVMEDPADTFADMVSSFHSTVTMEMPQLNVRGETISSGTSSSQVSVNGTHAAGSTNVSLSFANGTIKKGRFIKFNNHDKIYLVTSTFTTGSGILSIFPSLRQTVPSGTQLLYRDVTDQITFTAYREVSNVSGIVYTDGILSEAGNINLIEAL